MSEKLLELQKNMHNSPGGIALNRIKQFEFSKNIFKGNALELAKAIANFNGMNLMLDKEKSEQEHRDINRFLHNFLSSAKTLIEHSRIFVRSYYANTQFQNDYNKYIKVNLAENPLCRFVQDLRNFILHKGIPYTGIRHQWHHENGETTEISLDRDMLLEWDRWNKAAKKYLENSSRKISILVILQDYAKKIDALQLWFDDSLNKIHNDDFIEYNIFVEKYNNFGKVPQN